MAAREGYDVEVLRGDMTQPLPFPDGTFDLIFHPVSNCYVEQVEPIFQECFRVLKPGGALLGGYDTGISYAFDEAGERLKYPLPFDPLKNKEQYDLCMREDWGVQFSHTLDEQLGGQLRAGFRLTDLYEDTAGEGPLHEYRVPTFLAVRAVKPEG